MLFDLSFEVVSALLDSNSISSCYSISFIIKFTRSAYSMHQRAPQRVVELVLLRRVRNSASIRERNYLATFDIQIDGVHVDSRIE